MDESSVIGRISKQWTGFEAEAFTDADNFSLQFPMDLDVKIKAVLLGACFLIVSNMYTLLIQTIILFKCFKIIQTVKRVIKDECTF